MPTVLRHFVVSHVKAFDIVCVLLESPTLDRLKKHRVEWTREEKAQLPKDREASLCKASIDGETWYACWTHRAAHASRTFKGMLKAYPQIASTG